VSVFIARGVGRERLFSFTSALSFTMHLVPGGRSMGGEALQGVGLAEGPCEIQETV
jgi:hypothetical protein